MVNPNWKTTGSLVLTIFVSIAASAVRVHAVDPPSESQVLDFVDRHLPELDKVLSYLREHSPDEYDKALADLSRQVRSVQSAQKRGEHYYDNALESLKVETQIDLTVAKLQMRDDEDLRTQLRLDVRRLQQLRIERLTFERDAGRQRVERAKEMLAGIEQRLAKAQQAFDDETERSLESLLRKANRGDSSQQPARRRKLQDAGPQAVNQPD